MKFIFTILSALLFITLSTAQVTNTTRVNINRLGNNQQLINFNTDRAWRFQNTFLSSGNAASAALDLRSLSSGKSFRITGQQGAVAAQFQTFLNASINDTRVFFVPGGGRVGIGNSAPSAKLDILSENGNALRIRSSNNIRAAQFNVHTTAGSNRAFLVPDGGRVGVSTTSPEAKVEIRSENNLPALRVRSSNGARTVAQFNASTAAANNRALFVVEGGRVGIGNTSPGGKLDVRSENGIALRIRSTNNLRAAQFNAHTNSASNRALLVPDGGRVSVNHSSPEVYTRCQGCW